MRTQSITTADGARLHVESYGEGPGVILVGGTLTASFMYARFAKKLAAALPVHVYDRRGRGRSGPQPGDYSLESELTDLAAVMAATGSSLVLGHSYGGWIALESTLRLPVSRVAMYDPVINIDGCVPTHYLPELEAAVARGDDVRALIILMKGINARRAATRIPDSLVQMIIRAMATFTRRGRAWHGMLQPLVREIGAVRNSGITAARFAAVTTPVLLLCGADSDEFYRTGSRAVAGVLAHGSAVVVPGAAHDALDHPSADLLAPLMQFLTGP